MSLLSQVRRGIVREPRRCILYGVHGVGKSTWAANAPDPIFIKTEDGVGTIDTASFPLATSLADVEQAIGELLNGEHNFKTVVIDSLDWLEQHIWTDICAKKNWKHIEDGPYQKGYVYAVDAWRELLAGLDALRLRRNMGVILLGHTGVEKIKSPEDVTTQQFSPRIHAKASPVLREWADEVFFACYRVGTDPKKVVNVAADRIIRTQDGPTWAAKNRLGMPPEVDLDYAAYQYYQDQAFAGK